MRLENGTVQQRSVAVVKAYCTTTVAMQSLTAYSITLYDMSACSMNHQHDVVPHNILALVTRHQQSWLISCPKFSPTATGCSIFYIYAQQTTDSPDRLPGYATKRVFATLPSAAAAVQCQPMNAATEAALTLSSVSVIVWACPP